MKAIAKCKNHPSVRLIKNIFKNLNTFSFHYVQKEIMNLNDTKISQDSDTSDIPAKIIKDNLDVFNPNKAELFEDSFFLGRKKNLSNINITLYKC